MVSTILIAFFTVCAIILIPIALVYIIRFFGSNNSISEPQEHQTAAMSPMSRLSENDIFPEQNKHDSLKTEFLQHWDNYVCSVTTVNDLIENIRQFWVNFLCQVEKLEQPQDQTAAVSAKIQQLECMKISIPVEKQRSVEELKLGTKYITDSVASTYRDEYIPELIRKTNSINRAIKMLQKDQQQLPDVNNSADDRTPQTYSV